MIKLLLGGGGSLRSQRGEWVGKVGGSTFRENNYMSTREETVG